MSKPNTNIIRCTHCGDYEYIKKNNIKKNKEIYKRIKNISKNNKKIINK